MTLRSFLCALALCAAAPGVSAADLVSKPSPHSVAETLDRLEAAVGNAGATVFARVDHAKGAESVGSELAQAQMLMFGNPKLGTPAMQAAITAGLDLPLRVLAYEDASGQVQVVYHDPAGLAATHNIAADAEVIKMMTGALGKLTDAAVATE
ncbi:MAG: DUF302 domain-containing protein [Pseudomonadota bacterium]